VVKAYFGALGVGLTLAVLAGVSQFFGSASVTERAFAEAASRERESFLQSRKAAFLFDQAELSVGGETLDPQETLPQSHRFSPTELSGLYRYSKECGRPPRVGPPLAKAAQWHRFLCGHSRHLPADYFQRPPFIHPSGISFVRLAHESGKEAFGTRWLAEHTSQMPLLERAALDGRTWITRDSLKAILDESPLILTREFVLFRQPVAGSHASSSVYAAHPLAAWTSFLRTTPFTVAAKPAWESCLFREGNACWERRSSGKGVSQRLAPWLFFASLTVVGLSLIGLGIHWARGRARDREARLFTLQALTHELRTPATTLSLSLENLRRDFDALPETAQIELLRLCGEVGRLNRTIEASTRYLRSHGPDVGLRFTEVPSVNEFLLDLLEPYGTGLSFRGLSDDRAYRLDPFWLGICVKNLVDNALRHGAPPVVVAASREKSGLRISVSDGGGGPGQKTTSPGLGLGLAIVSKVAKSMRGRLTIGAAPTTFSLWLRSPL
jgi:signal transduction histidine kinase